MLTRLRIRLRLLTASKIEARYLRSALRAETRHFCRTRRSRA